MQESVTVDVYFGQGRGRKGRESGVTWHCIVISSCTFNWCCIIHLVIVF